MTVKERKDYIKMKRNEREEIQKKIKDLKLKRDKYVAEKRKKVQREKLWTRQLSKQ